MNGVIRASRCVFLAALFWTGMGVFFASQIMVLNRGTSWGEAFALTMLRWWVWGLLIFAIFWVDTQVSQGRSLVTRVALHVPLGIAWTCLSIVIRLVMWPLRGSPWPASFEEFFLARFYWDVVVYAVIAGVAIGHDYAEQVRQRERQAQELALQFSNGVIEVELADEPEPSASEGARGFVSIAFRVQKDNTFDGFYLRPTNEQANDQEQRNHATQYISHPDQP